MASEPRRAAEMSNFAELGSLTMEFTRLAQLTGEDKYYDAVARITDALVEWQERGTKVTGVFPSDVDTTGCNKTIPEVRMPKLPVQPAPAKAVQTVYSDAALNRLADIGEPVAGKAPAKRDLSEVATPATKAKAEAPPPSAAEVPVFANVGNTPGMMRNFGFDIDCPKQGLTGKTYGREHFSMGGGQDSTYEYFSKMYLLLGGLDDTYKKLYLDAMDAVREHMLFRPMIPEGKTRPILFSARLDVSDKGYGEVEIEKEYEVTHLTCFIGGMFGMGSRIFGIEQDLRIAEELTEGCVWAYDSTKTGIMPETARAIPCDGMTPCEWNETTWRRWLDPFADQRAINVAEWEEKKKKFEEEERIAEQQKALDKSFADEDAEVEEEDGDANVDEVEVEGETFTLGGHSKPAVALDARVAEHDEDADGSTLTKASSVKADTSTQLQKRKPPVYEEEEVQTEEAEIDEDETDYDGNTAAEAELQQGAAVPPTGTKLVKAGSGEDEGVNTVVDAPVVATAKAKATAMAMPKLSNGGSKWSEYLMPQNSKLGTRPQTHKEYVDARIQRERIPKGFGGVSSERYILR
jgi:mannosyl-oligosaccharide alpha-1,2-mannosidase